MTRWIVLFLIASFCASINSQEEDYVAPGDPEDVWPDAPQATEPPTDAPTEEPGLSEEEKKELSLDVRIRQFLEHFKQDDPKGIPGAPIPDPMPIPALKRELSGVDINLSEAQLHDLSQFRIDYVRTDLKELKVWVGLTFDTLRVVGRYRMSSWFSASSGDFNVTLITVSAEGFAGLAVDADGILQVSNITFDVRFKDIAMKFDNLGFFGSLFQSIINSVGTFIFDSIKPLILTQINDNIQKTINTQMKELDLLLPDSVPPLDIAMAMARGEIQDREMDPFVIPESNFTLGSGINVKIFNGSISGLSTIHRSGDITFNFENGSIVVGAQAATQRLFGEFKWQLDFRVLSPQGKMSLEIDGLDIKLGLKQPINIQKKPKLEVLKVSLGNIEARSSGTGSVDYLIEFGVNFLLNGFRSVILRTIEKPVITVIQEQLDKLDIEAMVEEQLRKMNEIAESEN